MSDVDWVEVREEWDTRTIPCFHQRCPYFFVRHWPDPKTQAVIDEFRRKNPSRLVSHLSGTAER